jgi:AcrR family transcriptional regulator
MDSTQRKILNAAGEVFAEHGFKAATVRDICKRAEVHNIAAVNYYFGDKEKLYQAVVRHAFQGSDAVEVPPPEFPEGATPAEKLRLFIRGFAATILGGHRPVWHMQIMGRELSQPSEACMAFVREFAQPHYSTLLMLLAKCLPPRTPARKRNLIALSIVGQILHHRCAKTIITQLVGTEESEAYTADLVGEHVADFTLKALGLAEPSVRAK